MIPGPNVFVPAYEAGLPRPSVANVTQVITANRSFLRSRAGELKSETLERFDHGLSIIPGLIS